MEIEPLPFPSFGKWVFLRQRNGFVFTFPLMWKFAQWSVVITLSLRNVRWALVAVALLGIQFSEGHSLFFSLVQRNGFLWDIHAEFYSIRKPAVYP